MLMPMRLIPDGRSHPQHKDAVEEDSHQRDHSESESGPPHALRRKIGAFRAVGSQAKFANSHAPMQIQAADDQNKIRKHPQLITASESWLLPDFVAFDVFGSLLLGFMVITLSALPYWRLGLE